MGGNANNGANAGTFYWNVNNDPSNRNRNIGTRMSLKLKYLCNLTSWSNMNPKYSLVKLYEQLRNNDK